MEVSDVCSLSFAVSGEKTPGVSGPTPPDVAEAGASAHPEDSPGQSDALHRSQVQRVSDVMLQWRDGWMDG